MENEVEKAYAEVDKILSLMETKYTEKIPNKLKELFKTKKLKGYEPEISLYKPLTEQNLKRKTFVILAILNLNFWCESEEEKQELINIYAENDKKLEKEMKEKYNVDNLFKKRKNEEVKENTESTEMIEYKEEKLIMKILKKIKSFFRRRIIYE